jgi:hypothetical protein
LTTSRQTKQTDLHPKADKKKQAEPGPVADQDGAAAKQTAAKQTTAKESGGTASASESPCRWRR